MSFGVIILLRAANLWSMSEEPGTTHAPTTEPGETEMSGHWIKINDVHVNVAAQTRGDVAPVIHAITTLYCVPADWHERKKVPPDQTPHEFSILTRRYNHYTRTLQSLRSQRAEFRGVRPRSKAHR